jgi:hypothetical protein
MALESNPEENDFHIGNNLPSILFKWINYEFWPWWMMYSIVLPYYLYLSIKAKNLFFFTNVNPSILHGGFKNYDKLAILGLIPSKYLPCSLKVEPKNISSVNFNEISLPVVVKPIYGERGRLIKVIHSKSALKEFIAKINEGFIIQELITLPNEATILWVKHPVKGKIITSFTTKEMMTVLGNGKETIKKILDKNPRFRLQINRLEQESKLNFEEVLPKGEKLLIEPIGNHCLGTKFINANHLIDQRLTNVFSSISDQIPDFHYGRFDFKYDTMEALYKGEHIKIIELNGVSSDPAHIFDQKTGFFNSLVNVCEHLKIMYDISQYNLKKGFKRAPFKEVFEAMIKPIA